MVNSEILFEKSLVLKFLEIFKMKKIKLLKKWVDYTARIIFTLKNNCKIHLILSKLKKNYMFYHIKTYIPNIKSILRMCAK